MAYAVKYNIPVRNGLTGDAYLLEIQEDGFIGQAATLKGAANAISLKYIDNDETKYAPIRASELTVNFISELFDMETIVSNDDRKYRVDLRRITPTGSQLNWRGFLSTDDLKEDYISGNRTFSLKATDGLGLLKNERNTFSYTRLLLTEIIQDCLQLTYTDLNFNIECGVYADYMSDFSFSNPFSQCRLHTRLFTNTDNGPANPYEILEAIMKTFLCTLFQQGGMWHIKRMPDERLDAPASSQVYDIDDLTTTAIGLDWLVQRNTDFIAVNASHSLQYIKATSESKYQHDYILPEIPANSDLTEGARFPFLDGVDSRAYLIDFWSSYYGLPNSPTAAGQAFRREVDDPDENINESYIVLPYFIQGQAQRLVSLDDPYIDERDVVEFSAASRVYPAAVGGPTDIGIARVRLYGDSGQEYILNYDTSEWEPVDATTYGDYALQLKDLTGPQSAEFTNVSVTSDPAPEGGRLVFWLMAWGSDFALPVLETHFNNIQITVKLFLNNTTFDLKGEKSTASDGTVSRKKNEVKINAGETPKRIIAGSLWKDSPETELTGVKWHTFDSATEKRLLEINSIDLQYGSFRTMRRLDGDFQGIKWTRYQSQLIGPGNLFEIDSTIYIATNIEMDIVSGIWSASLMELINDDRDEAYTGTIDTDFKYIFGNERS